MDRRTAEDRGEPVVSIVIVHYRTPDLLANCLAQIGAAQVAIPCEVLIVDNAPLDDAAEKVARAHGARYLCSERNVGYGRAVNRGMEAARGRYYLILNPDVEIRPGSVEALAAYLDAHPSAGLCGPKLFSPDGSLQYSARTFYTLKIILLRRTPIGRLFPRARALREHLMQDWDHADVREVDWMLGGAIMVRREAVADVGGMDARFFLYFEDVDWCSRMHRRGWRVVYVPHAEMVHAHQRISAHGFLTRGQRMHISSALRFWEKWSAVLYLWKKKSTQLRALATVLSDVVWLSVAFLAAYFLRYALGLLFPSWSTAKPVLALGVYARFIAFADLVAVGTFYFLGLYRSAVWRDRWREFFQLVNGVAITSLVVMASTFLFTTRPLSRFTILLFFPFSLLLVTLAREALRRVVAEARERRLHLRRLAVFAPKASIARLEERFRRHGHFGYEPIYLTHDDEARHPREGAPDPVVRRTRLLEDERIAEVVVFAGASDAEFASRLLPALLATGIPVAYIPEEEGLLLEARRLGDFMGFGAIVLGGGPRRAGSWLKRAADGACAGLLLVLGFPLHLVQVIAIGRSAVVTLPLIGRLGRRIGLRAYRKQTRLLRCIPAMGSYPALVGVLGGEVSFVGLSPILPAQWEVLAREGRQAVLDAPVGLAAEYVGASELLGAWMRREPGTELSRDELELLVAHNRRYVKAWSLSEDLRILLSALRGPHGPCGRREVRPPGDAT